MKNQLLKKFSSLWRVWQKQSPWAWSQPLQVGPQCLQWRIIELSVWKPDSWGQHSTGAVGCSFTWGEASTPKLSWLMTPNQKTAKAKLAHPLRESSLPVSCRSVKKIIWIVRTNITTTSHRATYSPYFIVLIESLGKLLQWCQFTHNNCDSAYSPSRTSGGQKTRSAVEQKL